MSLFTMRTILQFGPFRIWISFSLPIEKNKKKKKQNKTNYHEERCVFPHTHIYIYLCTYAYNNYQWLQTIIPVVIRLDDNMVTNEIFIIHTYIHITHTHTHICVCCLQDTLASYIYIYSTIYQFVGELADRSFCTAHS